MAKPCLPEERLAMTRTGSIGSWVGPAVTRMCLPFSATKSVRPEPVEGPSCFAPAGDKGSPSTSSGRTERGAPICFNISTGSGSLPGPYSPHAIGPSSGSSTITPRARRVATLAWVASWSHMRTFIAGTATTGLSVASSKVVARSSAIPAAILASRSAVAGQTSTRSAARLNWMWPISASSLRSHSEV